MSAKEARLAAAAKARRLEGMKSKYVKLVAISEGYYKNQIRVSGEAFMFNGPYKKDEDGEYNIIPEWTKLASDLSEKEYFESEPQGSLHDPNAAPQTEEEKLAEIEEAEEASKPSEVQAPSADLNLV